MINRNVVRMDDSTDAYSKYHVVTTISRFRPIMADILWMILFITLLGVAAGFALTIIGHKSESNANVKMWCTQCHRKQWVAEELVRQWVKEARQWDQVSPLGCEHCKQHSTIPHSPWLGT